MSELLQQLQIGAWLGFALIATVLALASLFPSMQGPRWTGNEWQSAIVLALLAIALKP